MGDLRVEAGHVCTASEGVSHGVRSGDFPCALLLATRSTSDPSSHPGACAPLACTPTPVLTYITSLPPLPPLLPSPPPLTCTATSLRARVKLTSFRKSPAASKKVSEYTELFLASSTR